MTNEGKLKDRTLDQIIDEMTNVVEKSKDEIFQISEASILEHGQLQKELEYTKIEVRDLISEGDKLARDVQRSRQRLTVVSSQFNHYTEKDIRNVYEQTHALQTELAIISQKEKVLREKRNDLERRLVRLTNTIEHANNLGRKVSVVLTYLYDDFGKVNDLLKDAKEKQEFGLKIVEAQEIERKRLSREIHDGPAQMIANILIRSELVDLSYREGNMEQALMEIKNMRQNLRSSLKEVRRIIFDLRPMALDDLGLFPTIKKHVARKSEYHHIPIGLTLLGEEHRLEPNYEVAVFRLIQEALQNALKHADPNEIKIIIELLPEKITVIIQDDGIGFDETSAHRESFGLVGMKERVEMLKGQLLIDTKLNHGTTVTFVIPYKMEDH
jgi:two-component system sensor histidine kinase DegS